MGLGGSILDMIVSLKNNSNLRKGESIFDGNKSNNVLNSKHRLIFKKVSKVELERIKQQNEREYKNCRKRRLVTNIIISVIIFVPAIWIFSNFLNESKRKEKQNNINWETTQLKKKFEKEEQVRYFLNSGYKWFSEKNYKNAKIQFYKAYELNNNDFQIDLANSKAYIFDCIENNVSCDKAEELIKGLISKYEKKEEVLELQELFLNNQNH